MSGITLDQVILDAATSNVAISDGTDTLAINGDGSLNATVTATDLDIRNLVFATDKVDVSGSTLGANDGVDIGDVTINNASLVVTATDLDIRDLIHTQDSMAIGDGGVNILDIVQEDAVSTGGEKGVMLMGVRQDAGTSPVTADGDYHYLTFNNSGELKTSANLSSSVADDAADAGNPIKMGGRGVSGLLSALSASNDRYDLLGDMYRRTFVNNCYNVGHKTSIATIGATAAEIVATPLAGRKNITIQNLSSASIWLGEDNTVTADDAATGGVEIPKGSSYTDDFGENIDIWLISNGAGRVVKIHEKG